jgi:hypothetical protein
MIEGLASRVGCHRLAGVARADDAAAATPVPDALRLARRACMRIAITA